MIRRQFLFSSLAIGTGLLALQLPVSGATAPERKPLIRHTVTARTHEPYRDLTINSEFSIKLTNRD